MWEFDLGQRSQDILFQEVGEWLSLIQGRMRNE